MILLISNLAIKALEPIKTSIGSTSPLPDFMKLTAAFQAKVFEDRLE